MDNQPYLALAAILIFLPLLGLILAVWHGEVRTLLIPKSEIARRADEMVAKFGAKARREALNEEFRASVKSDLYKQGIWRRIREELTRRENEIARRRMK